MAEATTSAPYATLHDGKKAPAFDSFGTKGELYGATITVQAESGSTVQVDIQLTDFFGKDLATVGSCLAYLSDNADGSTTGTAHTTSPVINTDGLMMILLTDLAWLLISESDGDISIDFVDSSTSTVYLVLVMPNGTLVISDAITHT